MSSVMNSHIRELQRRLADIERERDELRESVRVRDETILVKLDKIEELREALRPFAAEHRWARIAPRAAFARAAELVQEKGGE